MDLTTATPVEIDTVLADLYNKEWEANSRADIARDDVRSQVARVLGLGYRASLPAADVQRVVQQAMEMDLDADREQRDHAWYEMKEVRARQERVDAYLAEAADLREKMLPLQEEYARRPWTRFFAVLGGHIHSSMACSTCNKMGKATRFGWIVERSGQSEAQALESLVSESAKTTLCTVCFPNAPVAWTVVREDPNACPGSGSFDYPRETARLGYYSGNYGVCEHCGQRTTVTSTGKMRKHKKEA